MKKIRELWEQLTSPTWEEVEIQRLNKEREMLWKTVDRLEAEKAALEQELREEKRLLNEALLAVPFESIVKIQ